MAAISQNCVRGILGKANIMAKYIKEIPTTPYHHAFGVVSAALSRGKWRGWLPHTLIATKRKGQEVHGDVRYGKSGVLTVYGMVPSLIVLYHSGVHDFQFS
eukprot:scaffold10056_cov164-Amphora_coffeaeformis.AAC.9